MSLISRMRKQKCVYWAPLSTLPDGRRTFAMPVELSCRWQQTGQMFLTSQGVEAVSKAVAFVDRDVQVEGFLLLGQLQPGMTNDPARYGALVIRAFDKVPNFRVTEFLMKAIM